jgi:hypothetical protein
MHGSCTEVREDSDGHLLSPAWLWVLAAMIGEDRAAFFQIGEGAIVVSMRLQRRQQLGQVEAQLVDADLGEAEIGWRRLQGRQRAVAE